METRRAPAQTQGPGSERGSAPNGSLGAAALWDGPISERAIPDYLEPFIVEQEVSRYTAIDQAVWRFVLLQLQARLARTAHPSYVRGLAESGISAEYIPSIGEMNRRLAAIGWRAVCVDGFIPPRAFTAFQALGVLPIAAEIRTPDHLPYTPAPDIIHEAAGHAPILIDPRYAAYVKASGVAAARAFASPADVRVDRAVRLLSDLKDARDSLPPDVSAAEAELTESIAALGPASEAARMARLYWWTAEYGLVGSPSDYRLYGAGLLSSLGESHFCHGPQVDKRPLSAACVDVGYDITRPQPQLFVARDFEHLHAVLDEVSQGLAFRIGGVAAVRAALASRELCTVQLAGGTELIGTLSGLGESSVPGAGVWLSFEPGAALVEAGRRSAHLDAAYLAPVGPLADGTDPRHYLLARAAPAPGRSRSVRLHYASGVVLSGTLENAAAPGTGSCTWLSQVRIERPGHAPWLPAGRYPLLLADRVVTAGAGSTCAEVSPLGASPPGRPSRAARPRVPKGRPHSARQAELERLYAASAKLRQDPPEARLPQLESIRAELDAKLPQEWLLRWNLLECLTQLGRAEGDPAARLRARLLELEHYYEGKHPIALGLDYLAQHAPSTPYPSKQSP